MTALPAGGFEAKYDSNDLRWVTRTGIGWIRQQLDAGRYGWKDDPGPVGTIKDVCRLAVLSDWGTALYGAPECAKAIAGDGDFDLLLHLGDVYYAGTEGEIRSSFSSSGRRWPGR